MARIKIFKEVEVETKFNIGDKVWVFKEGARCGEISIFSDSIAYITKIYATEDSNTIPILYKYDLIDTKELHEEKNLFESFLECREAALDFLASKVDDLKVKIIQIQNLEESESHEDRDR